MQGEPKKQQYQHDLIRGPENGIVVEILGRVEPKMELHLSPDDIAISTPRDVHVCLQRVRLIGCCPEELYVDLVMVTRVVLVVW